LNVFDLPVNFPNYRELKVGDVFVMFVGNENEFDKKGNPMVHAHWYSVKQKDSRYAEIEVELMQCDNFGSAYCAGAGKLERYGWSKLQHWHHKTRWLRSPAAIVLFGSRVYGQRQPKK